MPAHMPDNLSDLNRRWQAIDWGTEPFCWGICSLQCQELGPLFSEASNFPGEYFLECHLRGRKRNKQLTKNSEKGSNDCGEFRFQGQGVGCWERATHWKILSISSLSPVLFLFPSLLPFLPHSLPAFLFSLFLFQFEKGSRSRGIMATKES